MSRARLAISAAVLAACGSTTQSPVTRTVAVLGYAKPPTIALVTRGDPDMLEPWVTGMRAANTAVIAVELPNAPDRQPSATKDHPHAKRQRQAETAELCRAANDATAAGPRLDEIFVIRATETPRRDYKCVDMESADQTLEEMLSGKGGGMYCVRWRYQGTTLTASIAVEHIRISSCEVTRVQTLATISNRKSRRAGTEFTTQTDVVAVAEEDVVEARRIVFERLDRTARHVTWDLFPRAFPITSKSSNAGTIEVGTDPARTLTTGQHYYLKVPSQDVVRQGIEVVQANARTTTLAVAPELGVLEPGDELHLQTDVRRLTLAPWVSGGVVRADGGRRGEASVGFSLRWSLDRVPVLAEAQLSAGLVPGVDSRLISVGGAVGVRVPLWVVAPIAFAEIGMPGAKQGDARAAGVYVGLGAGVELWLSRWFVFADIRRRWLDYDEWEDDDDVPLPVAYPDLTWIWTTVQIGAGARF